MFLKTYNLKWNSQETEETNYCGFFKHPVLRNQVGIYIQFSTKSPVIRNLVSELLCLFFLKLSKTF
jgi:hypothetical protein